MTGQYFMVNTGTTDIQAPFQYAKLQLWRNSAVANLTSTSTPITLGAGIGTLGYEWDIDADNGFRPAGEIDMSSTTDSNTSSFTTDYGTTVNPATETHHLSLYKAASGALVFGAGTVQWAWGLNNNNPTQSGTGASDRNMQQFTMNLLSDMGSQPATPATGLVYTAPPTVTAAPVSRIGNLTAGQVVQDGAQVTITGTATDGGGGVVAGVEISLDGGKTWHPVTSMSAASNSVTWSYTWPDAAGAPSTTVLTRGDR